MKLDRSQEIEIVRGDNGRVTFNNDGVPMFHGDNESFPVALGAIDTLLNMVKVPIKYFWRVKELDEGIAADNLNLWLKDATDIGGLVQDGTITQFFDSRRLFLPTDVVKQTVCHHLSLDDRLVFDSMEGGIYVGVFPLPHTEIEFTYGTKANLYLRIQFSDCFEIVPRIDLAVTWQKTFECLYYPVKGRKLRIAGAQAAQILNQITEFVDLVIEQGAKTFIPALSKAIDEGRQINPEWFAKNLCTDLRLSRKIGQQLVEGLDVGDEVAFVKAVGSRLLPEVRPEAIDLETARAIEIALTNLITKGSLK